MRPCLTSRQREILEFIQWKFATKGYAPTIREIGAAFGILSPNGVYCHLVALQRHGCIERDKHVQRGIRLLVPGLPPTLRLKHGGTIG